MPPQGSSATPRPRAVSHLTRLERRAAKLWSGCAHPRGHPCTGMCQRQKTRLLDPDFPSQRQDNVCYLQNYKRDVEIIKREGRGQLPSLSLTWEARNPDAQLWKIFFQQQHLPPWQALQASCLGSSAVASWFITWIC